MNPNKSSPSQLVTGKCRTNCGACCIAVSISSPLPEMPHGKPAGVPCLHLATDYSCLIHSGPQYPDVCKNLIPAPEICGTNRAEAIVSLRRLEELTRPESGSVTIDICFREKSKKKTKI